MFFAASAGAQAVTQEEINAVAAQLSQAQAAADAATETYYQALDAHDAAVASMNETQTKIDENNAKLQAKQDRLSARAVSMYRNGTPTMMDVIVGANSFEEFANAWTLLSNLNENDALLITDIKDLKAQLQDEYEQYEAQEKEAAAQMEAAAQARAELDQMVAQYTAQYNALSAEMQAQIAAQRAAQQRAAAAAYQQAVAAQQGGGGGGYTGGNAAATTGGGSTAAATPSYTYTGGGSYSGGVDYNWALSQVGKAYDWGSTGPNSYDCSGLAYAAGAPYRSSSSLYAGASQRLPVSQAQPGDILWTNGHVGISLGGNQYVHASDYGTGVVVSENADSAFSYVLRY